MQTATLFGVVLAVALLLYLLKRLDNLSELIEELYDSQLKTNTAVLDIAKGYKAVAVSTAKEARQTLEDVRKTVNDGVVAAAAAAAESAKLVPDSKHD